jgi:hypothetical protein
MNKYEKESKEKIRLCIELSRKLYAILETPKSELTDEEIECIKVGLDDILGNLGY